MNIKLLSFTIISAVFVSACGDSDHDQSIRSETSIPTTSFQQWTLAYPHIDDLSLRGETFTIDQGKIYTQGLYGNESNRYTYVTQNGVYDFGAEDARYGTYLSTVNIKNNAWIRALHSSIGSKELVFTEQFKRIDLSHKNVIDHFIAGLRLEYKHFPEEMPEHISSYFNAFKDLTFPQGAECLSAVSTSSNEAYLELDLNDADPAYYETRWNELAARVNPLPLKYEFKDTIAYFEADTSYNGVAKYKNLYTYATYYDQGKNFNIEESRQNIQDLIASTSDETLKAFLSDALQIIGKTCDLYNNTALQTIETTFER